MSYGRDPYYIFSSGKNFYMAGVSVPEDIVDAFLYKMLMRESELKRRLINGKRIWSKNNEELEKSLTDREGEILKSILYSDQM